MIQYFPKPYECPGINIKIELDIFKYMTKANLKEAASVNTSISSILTEKSDLSILKPDVDKRDKDKLKTTPLDLSKLSSIIDKDAVKKTVYDKLVIELNAVDANIPITIGLVSKIKFWQTKSWKID